MDRGEMLLMAQEFAEFGASLADSAALDSALPILADLAVKYIPGCTWVSITSFGAKRCTVLASSSEVARAADRFQHRLEQGPAVASAATGTSYRVIEVAREQRWPLWAQAVTRQTPVQSVATLRLAGQQPIVLTLMSDSVGAFDDESMMSASMVAASTATLLALHDAQSTRAQLTAALESNRRIATAMGILMAEHKVTSQLAFDMLLLASQDGHRKLRDIADQVVQTGVLPELRVKAAAEAETPS